MTRMTGMGGNPPSSYPCNPCNPWSISKSVAVVLIILFLLSGALSIMGATAPERARQGMVVAQERLAAEVGLAVLKDGGNAVDAAVASAFALAVTYPAAGNIGGGGFLLHRSGKGSAVAYDFREKAPAKALPTLFLVDGKYDPNRHHASHLAVGVPGTVAGLHLAWSRHGRLPWKRLVIPAVRLAKEGFAISPALADSLRRELPRMKAYPASLAQFSKSGNPYEAGEILRQKDLARSLNRIAKEGPKGFYDGETAALIAREMQRGGGVLTLEDLRAYEAKIRVPVTGSYRGFEIVSMPPPSSGGIAIVEILNILEGWELGPQDFGSARTIHRMTEAMRRAFSDRAQFLGDPDSNPEMPVEKLLSKSYANSLRNSISQNKASVSSTNTFSWRNESPQTTHLSVLDREGNAASLTFTLEDSYGSRIVVPGAGFLLNNEMGDFNAEPGRTDVTGLIGTPPNMAAPGKRMLSSMSPTMVTREGKLLLITGSPGGRTIINTVLETIVNTLDFGMNAQEAVDAPRFHHQWLPDQIVYELNGLSPDTLRILETMGHKTKAVRSQGAAQVIRVDPKTGWIEGAADRRDPDSAARGW